MNRAAAILMIGSLLPAQEAPRQTAWEGFVIQQSGRNGDATIRVPGGSVVLDAYVRSLGKRASSALRTMLPKIDVKPEEKTRLSFDPLLGFYLHNVSACVHDGVVLSTKHAWRSNRNFRENVAAIAKFTKIQVTQADARRALRALLDALHQPVGATSESTEIPTRLARDLLLRGDLDACLDRPQRLKDAVRSIRKLWAPTRYFAKDNPETPRLEFLEDAFGRRVTVLRGPKKSGYSMLASLPEYHWTASTVRLCVWVPTGRNPVTNAQTATSAAIYYRGHRIAWWQRGGALRSDPKRWRDAFPRSGGSLPGPTLANICPPHILIEDPMGRPVELITQHGSLLPLRNGSDTERERFLAEAAQTLKDAAHVDLIGQRLFRYVYDSPDPQSPSLLGTRDLHGEIHQTVAQTLGAPVGGICRGDCDDLAEVYRNILRRQGKLAHVIDVPAHAACAFVERGADGEYHSYVLHTQPPLMFTSASPRGAILLAFEHFEEDIPTDPNALPIQLRFSGENIRSVWTMSHRVFTDDVYAKAMQAVQRDWHYCTYSQGMAKMRALLDKGDTNPANFLEMCGLHEVTGQWELAIDWAKKALAKTTDEDSQTEIRIRMLTAMLQSKKPKRALRLLEKFLGMRKKNRLQWSATSHAVALSLIDPGREPVMAHHVLKANTTHFVRDLIRSTKKYLDSGRYDADDWRYTERWGQIRRLLVAEVGALGSIWSELRESGKQVDPDPIARQSITEWIDGIAFRAVFEVGDEMDPYAALATAYASEMGRKELWKAIDATAAPQAAIDHSIRSKGKAQRQRDFSWIKVAVPYWYEEMLWLFRMGRPLDRDTLHALAARCRSGAAHADRLGRLSPRIRNDALVADVLDAIVAADIERTRRLLRRVDKIDDKWLRDDATKVLAIAAPHLSVADFEKVLRVWHEEIHYKPLYFEIAWSTWLYRAKDQARAAARLAAESFPDDPTFAAERRYLEQLIRDY